jgi:DNA-binding beta-propeller fold protein YncE
LLCETRNLLYVSDIGCIRCIDIESRSVTTIAGVPLQHAYRNGPSSSAQFNFPHGLAFDPAGNLIVCDSGNNVIRLVDLDKNAVTTLAGNGVQRTMDGPAAQASFASPRQVVCGFGGDLFISQDDRHMQIRRFDAETGISSLFAVGLLDCGFLLVS